MAHYPLGLAYRGLGDTARAEAHLRQQGGVEIGPPDPLMVELRGLLHGAVAEEERGIRALDGGDFPAAAAAFRRGLESAPDNPSLRHKLGTALSLMGDTRGAMEQFQETVKRAPTFAQGYYSLGVMLASSGRTAEAIDRFATAIKYQPDYIEARLQLADAYRRAGQVESSLAQYRQAMAIDPRSSDARFGYALTLAALRRYDDAHAALMEGTKLFPDQQRFSQALSQLDALRRR
jgi:tetratricopeptide (TPR) repeat protein